ncbi:MAG: response regulator transcription factor, partial [Xanthomonadales bacterium]|nr:response regulator transcription factor [Xanthomonadales bacterium]
MIRIALADDQALVRSGLRALLAGYEDIEVSVEAEDGAEVIEKLAKQPVDLVLSDIRMPGVDGLALVTRLRADGNQVPVILLTTFDESDFALRAAECGAQGFLLKDASPEDLYEAIVRVARGETLLAPVPTDPVRARYAYRDQAPPTDT